MCEGNKLGGAAHTPIKIISWLPQLLVPGGVELTTYKQVRSAYLRQVGRKRGRTRPVRPS